MTEKTAGKIVVLRGGALGDFILTLPAIDILRNAFPRAELIVMAYSEAAFLLPECGMADRAVSLNDARTAALFADKPEFSELLVKIFSNADIVVNYLNDLDGVTTSNIKAICKGEIITYPPAIAGCHAAEHFKLPLKKFTKHESTPFILPLSKRIIEDGKQRLKKIAGDGKAIAIHPGSGSPGKNWPLENFIKIADILREKHNFNSFFITGEADSAIFEKLSGMNPGYPVLQNLSLESVSGILHASFGYVGNDSGITHLAAVTGTPTVALFGPTDPAIWGPVGRKVKTLKEKNFREISPEKVASCLIFGRICG